MDSVQVGRRTCGSTQHVSSCGCATFAGERRLPGMHDVERLFRAYQEPLVRYLTRRLGDRDWAEEVAQETFLRAVRHPTSVASERAWVFAVATNLVRDEARKTARQRRHLQVLAAEAREREQEEEVPAIERAHEAAVARRALERLGERDRVVLLLREEGLDYREIAEALGLSVGSVGTTLVRARRRLAEAYAEECGERRGVYGA
jgi:RNA polymerase sigma-70 factor, ECF subfamily